jgi:hypothetical protein
MPANSGLTHVNIRPGVTVLSILRHLNYRPWYALAEFVDNSIQSFLVNRNQLTSVPDEDFPLHVDIVIDGNDGGRIVIRDNAAGIKQADFPRAFRPAQLPTDRTGLAEFGMGMKSASCWFAPTWSVRTSALGEPDEKTIEFDIERIVQDQIEELAVRVDPTRPDIHFTEILLTNLHHVPVGRTIAKIKDHLRDIYRVFTRDRILRLRLNEEDLNYRQPPILTAPHFRDPAGPPVHWRQEFDFDFGDGLRAHGFAAIRQTASTSLAGFALFRRQRLIQGSGDEGYRPEFIFGKPNSFVYQRVFGEIHLEGFSVSHTKDGFQWDENEEVFLSFLKDELSQPGMPLLQQAREYRVDRQPQEYGPGAEAASLRTSETIRDYVPPVLGGLCDQPQVAETPDELPQAHVAARRVIDVDLNGQLWRIVLELSDDPAIRDWLEISDHLAPAEVEDGRRLVGLRLSLCHPFMQRFGGIQAEDIEPLLRVAAALGLGEVAARASGVRLAGIIRQNVNELLRNALCRT